MNSLGDNTLFQLHGKVFFITGADGFLGSHLVKVLLEHGAVVLAQVRDTGNLKRLKTGTDSLTLIPFDFRTGDTSALKEELPNGIDVCIHTAAVGIKPQEQSWDILSQVNINGTKAMLDVAVARCIKRFVYIGSSFEYGDGNYWEESAPVNPRTLYGVSKSAGWLLVKCFTATHSLPVVGFRPFYLYGPGEEKSRLISAVIYSSLNKDPLAMTLGEQERDFVYIDDAVRAILYGAIEPKAIGQMFNIASGQPTSIRRAVGMMEEETGQVFPLIWGKLPYRQMEWVHLSGNGNKAKQLLGFSTSVGLREGLKQTYESCCIKK